jgi:hypothetical protein
MNELQTIGQMREAYDGEWVIILDPECDEHGYVLRGRVAAHSPDKDEIHRKLLELPRQSGAIKYLGEVPKDLHFAL